MDNPPAALGLSHSNPQLSTSTTLSTPAAAQLQSQSQPQPPTSQQNQPQPSDTTQQPQSQSQAYPHQVTGDGGPTATAPFLKDFSLVAEAAKRAQVAIVTRDLEGVSL